MNGNEEFKDSRPLGKKTAEMLKKKGIKSPSIDGMVEISKGLWVVPNKVKNLDKLKKKYSKNDIIIQKGGYKSKKLS